MVYFSEAELDQLIHEDMPFMDLTTQVLGIGLEKGVIRYLARETSVICCTEEAQRILVKLGLSVTFSLTSGSQVKPNDLIMEAHGNAASIHAAWRVVLNLLEYASGIATRTQQMVTKVQQVNANVSVVATRKSVPGARKLMTKAIVCGGALPHRLGLSETILIFEEHIRFMPNYSSFIQRLSALKKCLMEKMITVETKNKEILLQLAQSGTDIVQLDKINLEEIRQITQALKTIAPQLKVAIAGGINFDNCADYAATGVDLIVTSALYFGKPADIKADIQKSV